MSQKYDDQTIQKAYDFYQKRVQADGFYVSISFESFLNHSINHQLNLHMNNHEIDGLLLYSLVDNRCYIAYLLGSIEVQKDLLIQLETEHLDMGIQSIWWSFYNPIKVPFYVKHIHIHVNAQGVPLGSPMVQVLKSLGYEEHAIQDTYHIDVSSFNHLAFIEQQTQKLNSQGIEFKMITGHSNLVDGFLKRLNNPGFVLSIQQGMAYNKPILYVLKNGVILGFTGPVGVAEDGRGTFGGIEVLDELKGLGAGKLLFFKLIQIFKDMGSTYTTLFTGRDNPAQHIYMAAGATKEQSFIMMKKEL